MAVDQMYTERDIRALDRQGGYYSRHLNAMTGEKLHDKSDIAAELAWRDARIEALEARMEAADRERSQHKALSGRWCREHHAALVERDQAVRERDTLAAHVKRIHSAVLRPFIQCCSDEEALREARQIAMNEPLHISLDRLKAQWQAEGAGMVAESAWSRKHLEPFGITPQECAANLATLISNDLRRKAKEAS